MFSSKPAWSYPFILGSLLIFPLDAFSLAVKITPDLEQVNITQDGKEINIQRIQDQSNTLEGGFSKTSRVCPPFCIQPIKVADDVTTVGELELLEFIQTELKNGTGLLIDARTANWHSKGTIPGSINIPFTTFTKNADPKKLSEALKSMGAKRKDMQAFFPSVWRSIRGLFSSDYKASKWDFSEAKHLMLWCNGMWCGQSPTAIKGLLALGYPAEKIRYYRGGMQSWKLLGLTTVLPEQDKLAQY